MIEMKAFTQNKKKCKQTSLNVYQNKKENHHQFFRKKSQIQFPNLCYTKVLPITKYPSMYMLRKRLTIG